MYFSEIKVYSYRSIEFFVLKFFYLRFPIPDFRPAYDINRIPWWKRHVRSDFLLLKLHHTNAHTTIETNQLIRKYCLECHSIDVFYCDSALSEPLVIGKATVDSKNNNAGDKCELKIIVHPSKKEEIEMEPVVEREIDMTQSIYGSLTGDFRSNIGPFSSKRVIHASDTAHARDSEGLLLSRT